MKDRADKVLVDRTLVSTRSQAKVLIEKGDVLLNGKPLTKAGELIDIDADLTLAGPLFVGRGAFKLIGALDAFCLDVTGLTLLDVGASTGGFTEVLLERGARKVYAIDVGHDQLAPKLRQDPRVVNLEEQNIRELRELPELADGAVMDLSFISVTKVLSSVQALLKEKGFLVVLIKPQFEAGRERLPKDSIIKDEQVRQDVLREVREFAEGSGWKVLSTILSPIEGKSGNVEFLCHFIKI